MMMMMMKDSDTDTAAARYMWAFTKKMPASREKEWTE